mgnify:FL=1
MKIKVTRADVWAASIEDKVGGLAPKLEALAAAGANLAFIIARRSPEKPGQGVVFLTPIRGAKQIKAAKAAGFHKTATHHSICVVGGDKPGLGAKMTEALAGAGISLRGLSAAVLGKNFVTYIAVDTEDDAKKAVRVLKKLS